jgi:branched-subunit amino acid ABC-type transport system permease component
MTLFFARIFAVMLAAAAFAAAAAVLLQLRAESPGGWGLILVLGVVTLLLPVIVYRVILSPLRRSSPPNEGEGAGLAMGAGLESARRRDLDDPDPFGD